MKNTSPLKSYPAPPQNMHQAEEGYGEIHSTWQSQSPSFNTPNSMTVPYSDSTSYRADDEPHMQMDMSPDSHTSFPHSSHSHHSGYSERNAVATQSAPQHNLVTNPPSVGSGTHTEDAAAELLALRYLPNQTSQCQSTPAMFGSNFEMRAPPNMDVLCDLREPPLRDQNIFNDQDGIFLPGSAYRELHSTLRDHLIYTARSNAPTRNGTPEPQQPDMGFFERGPPKFSGGGVVDRTGSDPESVRSSKPPEITPQREYVLWKTWIDEIAPWVYQLTPQWTLN